MSATNRPARSRKYPVYDRAQHGNPSEWILAAVRVVRARQGYDIAMTELGRKLKAECLREAGEGEDLPVAQPAPAEQV